MTKAEREWRSIVERATKLRADIDKLFADCMSWNDNRLKDWQSEIDPDPDGNLKRIADVFDRMIQQEQAANSEVSIQ